MSVLKGFKHDCDFSFPSFRWVEWKLMVHRWSSPALIADPENAGAPILIWMKTSDPKLASMQLNMVPQRQHPYFQKNPNLKNLFHSALQSVFVIFIWNPWTWTEQLRIRFQKNKSRSLVGYQLNSIKSLILDEELLQIHVSIFISISLPWLLTNFNSIKWTLSFTQ